MRPSHQTRRRTHLARIAAGLVTLGASRAHAQSTPVPADARVAVHVHDLDAPYTISLGSEHGSASCEGPCTIPVLAGPHEFTFRGAITVRRTIDVPRGFSRIDVRGQGGGRRGPAWD